MQITLIRIVLAALKALIAMALVAQTPLLDQGRAALSRGDSDAAIAILEKAVAESPKSAEAHFYLGNAYGSRVQKSGMFSAARSISKVRDEFERAVALNPRYVDARFALVEFYALVPRIMGGSYDRAFDQANAIRTIDPIAGHRAFSFIYSQQKKPDLAKKEYLNAIREQPTSPKAHGYYGQYLANVEKNYGAAFPEFETALKLDPTYMPPLYFIGRAASLGNTNLARGEEALKKYLAYTPKENEPTLASAWYYLGTLYEKGGKKAEAKQSYQAALRLNPSLKQASEALRRLS